MNKTQEKFLTDEEFETQKDDITAIVSAEMEKIEKEIDERYNNNPEYKAQIDAAVEEELRIAAEYRACKTQEEMEELDRKYGVEVIH